MKIKSINAALLIAMMTLAISCDNNDDTSTADQGYLLGFRTATDPTADYLVYEDDLSSGSVSATGRGIEQQGWSYYAKAGNTYLSFDYENNIARGYRFENGDLKEAGQFAFERMDLFGEGMDGTAIGIGAPWGGGSFDCKIQIIDGESVSISKSVTTPVYDKAYHNGQRLNAWPTAAWIQNGKLFVPFYPLVGDSWETPLTDTAYVSVYSYPELVYQSTFKDTRTGPVGYYSSQPCVLEDESGNHYTLSSSSLGAGYTQSTKPSGILKINSGETKFDDNYFFNTEALGYRVLGGAYVGNGKVVARVVSTELDNEAAAWAQFSVMDQPVNNIAILDLNAKTLVIVDEIPLHGGQYLTPFLIEDGKVWVSITTSATDAFLYHVDAATGTATRGARIEGSEIQTFFRY